MMALMMVMSRSWIRAMTGSGVGSSDANGVEDMPEHPRSKPVGHDPTHQSGMTRDTRPGCPEPQHRSRHQKMS